MARTSNRNPSRLDGTYRSRVFVGGSYRVRRAPPVAVLKHAKLARLAVPRDMLDHLRGVVRAAGLHPILAAEYAVADPDRDIHHDALCLLHACRLAIFDLSEFSGALMEIERSIDYGALCLVLYEDPLGDGWRLSRMLSSFANEHRDRVRLYGYGSVREAKNAARNWIADMRSAGNV